MLNFWGPKKDKKVINSSTKCLISVKISVMTPHIIPLPLVNVWLIFDLQKYVNWLCLFSKVNPFFQKAQVFCMDLQPAADPYNVVCRLTSQSTYLYRRLKLHVIVSYLIEDPGPGLHGINPVRLNGSFDSKCTRPETSHFISIFHNTY